LSVLPGDALAGAVGVGAVGVGAIVVESTLLAAGLATGLPTVFGPGFDGRVLSGLPAPESCRTGRTPKVC
jgi:hypothetical protein